MLCFCALLIAKKGTNFWLDFEKKLSGGLCNALSSFLFFWLKLLPLILLVIVFACWLFLLLEVSCDCWLLLLLATVENGCLGSRIYEEGRIFL